MDEMLVPSRAATGVHGQVCSTRTRTHTHAPALATHMPQPLSQLSSLRRLGFIDPSLPHETLPHLTCCGLTNITALTALSRLTELDAGAW